MLTEQFELIYKTLLKISVHSAVFQDEKRLIEIAQKALATGNVKQMWQALVEISLQQGFHTDEKRIIHLGQVAIKKLLLQMKMLDEPVSDSVRETRQ